MNLLLNKNSRNLHRTSLLFAFFLISLVFLAVPTFAIGSLDGAMNLLASGALKLGDTIVGAGQIIFLQVIYNTILEFGKFWTSDAGGGVVFLKEIWRSIRDIVNLLIVVLFVVITMLTVFGEFSFRRRVLIGLVLAALLVNFSAFFVLFVIDISNILFVMFFNLLHISEIGTLSPFYVIASKSIIIDNAGWNLFFGIIALVTSFFIFAGVLYLCIILVERFIIALFLVVFSPLLVIGFFLNIFGAKSPMTDLFVKAYITGKERLLYIFSAPIIIMFGYSILYTLFLGIVGDAVLKINSKDVPVEASEAIGPDFFRIILASIVLIYGIFQVGKLAQSANITGSGGFTLFGKNIRPGAFFKQRASNLAHPGRALRGAIRNSFGRIPGVRNVLGPLGLGAPKTRFYEPGHRLGKAVRGVANFAKDAESGKYWENNATTFNEFRTKYKSFSDIDNNAKSGWDERRQERYHQLNDRIASFMSDNDRKKGATEGKNDGWLKSQIRQMNGFLGGSEGNTRSGNGETPSPETPPTPPNSGSNAPGEGSTPPQDGDAGAGEGGSGGDGPSGDGNGPSDGSPSDGGVDTAPSETATPTSGRYRNAGRGRRDRVGDTQGNTNANSDRATASNSNDGNPSDGGVDTAPSETATPTSGRYRNAGRGRRDRVGGARESVTVGGDEEATGNNPNSERSDSTSNNTGASTSGSRNAGRGRRDRVDGVRESENGGVGRTNEHQRNPSDDEVQGGGEESSSTNSNDTEKNTTTNEHTTLDVKGGATWDEVKKAYRKLARKHHPDKGGDHDKMAEINSAYKTLKKHYNKNGGATKP